MNDDFDLEGFLRSRGLAAADVETVVERFSRRPISGRMRYDCAHAGCYLVRKAPKISFFDDCFPTEMHPTVSSMDLDMVVEKCGHMVVVEFSDCKILESKLDNRAQRILFDVLNRALPGKIQFHYINFNPLTMKCFDWAVLMDNYLHRPAFGLGGQVELEDRIRAWFRHWSLWVEQLP